MNQWLRRRARLLAGSLAVVLLAGVAYVGHSAGSDAQPARAVRQIHAIAPVLAPVSQRRLSAAASGPAASASRSSAES
ncbi:MAG TPA: hypothetical protein VJ741_20255, partial [Solirubrobacteraceae bacterium]|nr:hypothetical protein [Solirubrobacteraceae bacterium]